MQLVNVNGLKTGKDLKRPAARLTSPVHPVLSRQLISLEKNGGLRCLGESIRYLWKT
jgi:hypothetical protein